jgi:hypothetical protein
MKMDPSLHLVSDQTSAEVRGRTAEFEELVTPSTCASSVLWP